MSQTLGLPDYQKLRKLRKILTSIRRDFRVDKSSAEIVRIGADAALRDPNLCHAMWEMRKGKREYGILFDRADLCLSLTAKVEISNPHARNSNGERQISVSRLREIPLTLALEQIVIYFSVSSFCSIVARSSLR